MCKIELGADPELEKKILLSGFIKRGDGSYSKPGVRSVRPVPRPSLMEAMEYLNYSGLCFVRQKKSKWPDFSEIDKNREDTE